MRSPLILLAAALAALPARAAAPVADACDVRGLARPPSCASGPLCGAGERVAVACSVVREVEERWVFATEKPRLLAAGGEPALDVASHLARCVAAERAIVREDDPLRFYDRMRRCLAALSDGHLIAAVPGDLPPVALGVGFRLASDATVRVAWWSEEASPGPPALVPGSEVVAVDGVPVARALAELGAYLPASSRAARQERAVDALGWRDFAYPDAPMATLTVREGATTREVPLRWSVPPGARENALLAPWLARVPVAESDDLDWSAGPRPLSGDPADGAFRGDPALAPADASRLVAYRGEAGQLAARAGDATTATGRTYCYLQLLTLHTQTLAAAGDTPRPLLDVVADHVARCDARRLDLVLDLRQNEGGYLFHATDLARLLASPGSSVPRAALLARASDREERVFRARAPAFGSLSALWTGSRTEVERVLAAIRAARRRGAALADAVVEPPSRAERGFGGRVVALVSPTCMSACERLAAMLQASGAMLVGGPTEGAGGSQQQAPGMPARWVDPSGRLALSIPTAAMGVAAPSSDAGGTVPPARFFAEMALEARPVRPDVAYATSADDLVRANAGWRAAAESALETARSPSPGVADRRRPDA